MIKGFMLVIGVLDPPDMRSIETALDRHPVRCR